MKSGELTFRMNQVQKVLDHGYPIKVQGREYFQLDKLYMRAEVFRGDERQGFRTLDASVNRLGMLGLVEKMSEEEFFDVASLLTLQTHLKDEKTNLEMLRDAMTLYDQFTCKDVRIGAYINHSGDEVRLEKPLVGRILSTGGSVPFTIACDLDTPGKRISSFETIWDFLPSAKSDLKGLPKEIQVYGTTHAMDKHVLTPPRFVRVMNPAPEITPR